MLDFKKSVLPSNVLFHINLKVLSNKYIVNQERLSALFTDGSEK